MKALKVLYKFLHPSYQTLFLDYKVNLQPRYGSGKPPHEQLYKIINNQKNDYKILLEKSLEYIDTLQIIKDRKAETNPINPVWNNGFLPGLDIVGLYTLIAELKPAKYVEIGSGNSTKIAYKAKLEQKLNTEIISIDPKPRAEIDKLANKIIREPAENIDFEFIHNLQANDILFIDNSHRILPNSDSMVFFLEILPKLKKGVVIHIHDIYLPHDYPQFMCDRAYSEQYLLACYLLANSKKYKPLLPCFFISEDKELSGIITPIWEHKNLQGVEKHGGSFWLRIEE